MTTCANTDKTIVIVHMVYARRSSFIQVDDVDSRQKVCSKSTIVATEEPNSHLQEMEVYRMKGYKGRLERN